MSKTKKIKPDYLKLISMNHFQIQDFFEEEEISEDLIKKWNMWCNKWDVELYIEDYMDTDDFWDDEYMIERIGEEIKETDSSDYDEEVSNERG